MDPVYHFVKTREREYVTGIPARDLKQEDLDGMTAEQLAAVEVSPLYKRIERPAARKPAEASAPAERGGGN